MNVAPIRAGASEPQPDPLRVRRFRLHPEGTAMNLLAQLRQMTVVVADSGDFDTIAQYKPRDTTTNPSLLLKAAQMSGYHRLLEEAITSAQNESDDHEAAVNACMDRLLIGFGKEILKIVPGRVSTEVDARLSFD